MCIICNLTHKTDGFPEAIDFLDTVGRANKEMKKAEKLLLEVSKHVSQDDAKRYKRIHKKNG